MINLAGVAQLAEQLTCNQQVAGSSPIASSIKMHQSSLEGFPSGQREQTVNLSSDDFGGSNPPPSTITDFRSDLIDRLPGDVSRRDWSDDESSIFKKLQVKEMRE